MPRLAAIKEVEAFRVHRRFDLFAYELRKRRHGIELFDLLDQVEQDLFLIVGFAEESPINPMAELAAVFQAQAGSRDHQEQDGIAGQNRRKRQVAIDNDRQDQRGNRQRQDEPQDLLGEQVLQAAANDDVHIKGAMFQ